MKIRSYREDDYQFTHDLHRENMLDYVNKYWGGWNSKIFRRDMHPEITWIIEHKKQKAGFFILNFTEKALLMNIQIKAEFQNKGIGKVVITHCEKESRKRGFHDIYLQVFLDNPARRLYERLEYQIYETTKSHIKMKKVLS